MPGRRVMTSILTGVAFLLQTLLPPLAGSAQPRDPIGPGGFIGSPQPPDPSPNQTTQSSRNFLVRVCVPPDLVKNQSWDHPAPGSEMAAFRSLLRNYILSHGDPRIQYRIKDQAFEIYNRARRASAPYTPDPRNLLEEVSAEQACPPTNYTNTLEVGPDDNSPNPPAQPPAVQDSAPAYPLTPKDAVQVKCDQLAESPDDPQKVGSGVPLEQISVNEALPVCQQAATRQAYRPRYLYLYGRVLEAAHRYQEAAKEYALAGQYIYPLAALRLGRLYETGQGVPQNWDEAARWYLKATNSGFADGYAAIASHFVKSNPPNYAEAAKWAQKAAQGGSAIGSMQLAWLYRYGQGGVNKDPALAMRSYEEAAKQGESDAMYRLGLHFRAGNGVAWSEAEAMQWLKKAGDQGSAEAEYFVAMGYEYGLGQDVGQGIQDYRQAVSWLTRSADHGDDYALTELGMLYENGWGVDQDLPQVKRLYQKASNSSIPEVAKFARSCVADLSEKGVEASPTRPPRQPEQSSGIVPLIAIGAGILLLASLFSGPSEHGTDGGPPIVSGNSTASTIDWPTSTPSPPAPSSRQVPDSAGSMTPNGLDLSNPTHGGGSTHREH